MIKILLLAHEIGQGGSDRVILNVAESFVNFHQADAAINGLTYDMHKEEEAVELFAENIMRAGQDYNYSPMETPFIPSWARVLSAVPDIGYRLRRAVEADNQKLKTAA